MANGSRHSLYAVLETEYGVTPASPALDLVRITGTTLGLSKDSLQSEEIRSDRQIADFRLGANQVGGDINFELSYGTFDKLLQSVLLADTWQADTPAAGSQQIKSGVTRSSFTMVRHFNDILAAGKPYYVYRGLEITAMSLSVAANAIITGAFTVVGKSQVVGETHGLTTPTFPPATTTPPMDAFTGTLLEGGVPIAVVTEISLTLQNTIEPRFVIGSKDSILPSVGRSNLTGQITAYFENSTLVEKFLDETPSNLEFTLTDTLGNAMTYVIPRIKYTGGQPDVSGEGPITLAMPFQAILDPTTGTNLLIQRNPV